MSSGDIFRDVGIALAPHPVKPESDIDRCDRKVSVVQVASDFFNLGVDPYRKSSCPFGFEHSDAGMTAAVRLYGNRLHCYAGHGSMPPSRLVALQRNLPRRAAAELLLEKYGMERRRGWRGRAATLINERSAAVGAKKGHVTVAAALSVYLSGLEGWVAYQFTPEGHRAMQEQLEALASVPPADADLLSEWLTGAKATMRTRVREATTDQGDPT